MVEDTVNHPKHYTNHPVECIEEMKAMFGLSVVANFCMCNVWKYRYRAMSKNGEEDLKKADWYMEEYLRIQEAMGERYEE